MKRIYLFITLSLLGCQFNNLGAQSTDYIQVVVYGQSLGMGWQSPRAITNVALDNNYMTGSNVNTLYSSGTTTLNPLVAVKWKSGGEQPIVSCVNAYSKAYREKINADQKFIAITAGEGGRTIERLSKECTNEGYYESTFIKSLDNTLAAINGKTVSCSAIIYMQGEHNSVSWRAKDQGLTPGTNGTLDKTEYKDLLLTLKNNMQADIMAKYEQSEKPLFFIYQTSGGYLKIKDLPVVMAQIEFAEENSDVVLLNPHYAMPDYTNGHLSTNGYRWYGELMSKSLIKKLVNKSDAETLKPTNFDVNGKKITIDYHVPVPPLVLDTWTTPMQSNYGFEVYKNNSVVTISSVELLGDNQVEITCNTDLTGKVEVVYAGTTVNGSGNLRDSDDVGSMYTYYNDSGDSLQESYTPTTQNGGSIYGQSYGLQNWSNMFYYSIGDSDIAGIGDTFSVDNIEYTITSIDDLEVEVSGSTLTELTIPTSVTGLGATYNVTAIGKAAFLNSSNLTSVVLPTSVVLLKGDAFSGCVNLERINLESIVVTNQYNVFYNCPKLTTANFESLTDIGRFIFYGLGNSSLSTVSIPSAINIGKSAFNATVISSIDIPSTVVSIEDKVFMDCTSLTEVQVNWVSVEDIPVILASVFLNLTPADITLYVPSGKAALYEAAAVWTEFTIVEGTLSAQGVKEIEFSLFPNPTNDIISIRCQENIINVSVLNANGSLLLNSNSTQLDFSTLASGVYFVKVKTANGVSIKKVIKK